MPGTEISDWWDMLFRTGNDKVIYTWDEGIFHNERWSRELFTYRLPVAEPGNYVIITQHTEVRSKDRSLRRQKAHFQDHNGRLHTDGKGRCFGHGWGSSRRTEPLLPIPT